ncbi:hypothetical protein ACEPAH_3130 [Sanghuangporus vaninii]
MPTAIEEMIVSGVYYYLSLAVLAFYVTYPISSTVIKYRANYAPRPIQLIEEGNQSQSEAIPPRGDSFLGMLKRVYQLESWRGFFKGSSLILVQYFVTLVLSATMYRTYSRIFHPRGVLSTLVTGLFEVIIFLPLRILITREPSALVYHFSISSFFASQGHYLALYDIVVQRFQLVSSPSDVDGTKTSSALVSGREAPNMWRTDPDSRFVLQNPTPPVSETV